MSRDENSTFDDFDDCGNARRFWRHGHWRAGQVHAEIGREGYLHEYEMENAMSKQVRQTGTSGTVKAVSVADYIVERLAVEGIDHCFGVAGDYAFPTAMRLTAARR